MGASQNKISYFLLRLLTQTLGPSNQILPKINRIKFVTDGSLDTMQSLKGERLTTKIANKGVGNSNNLKRWQINPVGRRSGRGRVSLPQAAKKDNNLFTSKILKSV